MSDSESTGQERTESPTPKRKQQAREEGRVARSQEVSGAVVVLAGAATLATVGGATLVNFANGLMRESARWLSSGPMTSPGAIAMVREVSLGLTLALLPFAITVFASVTGVNLAQARGVLTIKPLEPKFSHISPMSGLKRLLSPDSVFTLVKSLAKLGALSLVLTIVRSGSWRELMSLAETQPRDVAVVLGSLLKRLTFMTGLTFLGVAMADYLFQVRRLEKSLKMTREEVVREARESEGNPIVKARILSIMRARARKRMMQRVPTADVVIVNPTEIAIALKYDTELAPAPIVVAMGQRKIAERIRELARASNVPSIENRPVARALLATAVVGRAIPPALYAAVAEILAFVYRRRAGWPAGLERHAARGDQ